MHSTLVIIGASGQGKVVADIALKLNQYEKILFLDDGHINEECLGMPVVGKTEDAHKYIGKAEFFVAIGNADVRARLMNDLEQKQAEFATLIHPSAFVGTDFTMEKGTVVMAGAVINPCTTIGKGCIINTCASVDHDCVVGDYVHVAVGARLCGTVTVGENTWIGAGAVIRNNTSVLKGCVIGVGATVVKDICESGTYVGVPAKKIK